MIARWLCLAVLAGLAVGCGGEESSDEPPAREATPAADRLSGPARYYVDAVNREDLEGLVETFAPDAVVIDVSRRFAGREAIQGWAENEVIGGRLEVLEVRPYERGTRMNVRFRPGGGEGFEACYTFDTRGTAITRADLQYEC